MVFQVQIAKKVQYGHIDALGIVAARQQIEMVVAGNVDPLIGLGVQLPK